jgi:hypothetical protein
MFVGFIQTSKISNNGVHPVLYIYKLEGTKGVIINHEAKDRQNREKRRIE